MTPEEREKMNRLCILIQSEQDPAKFTALMKELNELLESKGRRFSRDQSHNLLL
jgi:hypothetical protein